MKIKNYLIGAFLLVSSFAFVGIVSAATTWDPLVKIPGIPSTGINLSTYLVGLYNFMLSVVGIVAVMMLIVAGMRYITAAGNATSVTDAKSIAGNAVVGLLLALLSFVILKTINPDVLYLKKPGSGFAGTTGTPVDLGSCGSYDSAGVCTCANNEIITPAVANAAACNTACEASPELCRAAPKNVCLLKASEPGDTNCYCINKNTIPIGTATNCQDACAVSDCVVADLRVGPSPNPKDKSASVKIDENVYLDARSYSVDYSYNNLNRFVDYDDPSFDNGIDRYEMCFDEENPAACITLNHGCSDGASCSWVTGALGWIGSTFLAWAPCGTDVTSYGGGGTKKIKLYVRSTNGCIIATDEVIVNVN
ncbi:MAG: hypothetical protein KAI57_00430 [Candidatus Pacebacteria bacterium]|nr:hypothetical protein [Candidatus Paceibacterota bacterium]